MNEQIKIVKVNIKAENAKTYPIIIGSNLLATAGRTIKNATNARKFLIVTDENVEKLYMKEFLSSFSSEEVECLVFPAGEKTKNAENLIKIWKKAVEIKLERQDAIIGFGGGVIGDLTGFAAATYLRGVDFIQVPTTLLAQVDSSVGGKVAIDLEEGKNLVGAFYQPKIVLSDTTVLKTLPLKELKTGLAEVLKYAFIEKSCLYDEFFDLFEFLSKNKTEIFEYNQEILKIIVEDCCLLKSSVVSQDEKEAGLRAILNFGHTIGHAIEKCTNYEMFTHGEAIAMGMMAVFDIAKGLNASLREYCDDAKGLFALYELDFKLSEKITVENLMSAMSNDKKVSGGKIKFVVSTNFAEVGLFDNIPDEAIKLAVKNLYLK